MLSKYVAPGSKLELRAVDRTDQEEEDQKSKKKFYRSQVCDILSEDQLEIRRRGCTSVLPMWLTDISQITSLCF